MHEFIKDGGYIYLNVPYAEAYISESIFGDPAKDSTIACDYGNGIQTIGLFCMRLYDTDEPKNRESSKIRTFNYPNLIITYPSEYSVEKLIINGVEDTYRVLKYYQGDIMIESSTEMDTTSCERFMKLLAAGKIPPTISYKKVFDIWLKNLAINDMNPGVPYVTMQVIISEMYRDKDDPSRQFRKVAGHKGADMLNYIECNMNEVSSYSSVLSALTFERFADKLTTSLTMTKEGIKQNKSPVEKVITY